MHFTAFSSASVLLVVAITQVASQTCSTENTRLRQNWYLMSPGQQALYHDSVLALKAKNSTQLAKEYPGVKYTYDFFVNTHLSSVPYAHGCAMFLPWHRKFLKVYEDQILGVATVLKSKDTAGTYGSLKLNGIPYYDWAQPQIASNPYKQASLFDDKNFGTLEPATSATPCVTTGKYKNWKLQYSENPGNVGQCLSRDGNGNGGINAWMNEDFMKANVLDVKLNPDFASFRPALEGMPHALPHIFIGGGRGEMMTMGSPNDPIFFLHHANVDRYWHLWQLNRTANLNSYSGPNHKGSASQTTDLLMFLTDGKQWLDGTAIPADVSQYQLSTSDWKSTIAQAMDSKKMCIDYESPTKSPTIAIKGGEALNVPEALNCVTLNLESNDVSNFLKAMRIKTTTDITAWKTRITGQKTEANRLINKFNLESVGKSTNC